MALNPRFIISIQSEDGQEESVRIMKQELKNRLIQGNLDHFALRDEQEDRLVVSFSHRRYTSQKEFLDRFEEQVMKPARKAAGLEPG